jgi:hypothetical protein
MPTLKERAPHLFETQTYDAEGRVEDKPEVPVTRVPSPVEVVNFVLSQHHITPDNVCAIDVVNSLQELVETAPEPASEAPMVPDKAIDAPAEPQSQWPWKKKKK